MTNIHSVSNDHDSGRRRRRRSASKSGKIRNEDVVFPTMSNTKRNFIIFGILIAAMIMTVIIIKIASDKGPSLGGSFEIPTLKK